MYLHILKIKEICMPKRKMKSRYIFWPNYITEKNVKNNFGHRKKRTKFCQKNKLPCLYNLMIQRL